MNSNLKPFTKENAKENGRKGGIMSAKKRAMRKTIKNELEMLMEFSSLDAEKERELIEIGINENEINNQTILIYSIFKRALDGDMKASKLLIDILNDIPSKDSLGRIFYDL